MLEGKSYQRNYQNEKKKAETRKRTTYLMIGRKLKIEGKRSLVK